MRMCVCVSMGISRNFQTKAVFWRMKRLLVMMKPSTGNCWVTKSGRGQFAYDSTKARRIYSQALRISS